jgi:hypothetical protein
MSACQQPRDADKSQLSAPDAFAQVVGFAPASTPPGSPPPAAFPSWPRTAMVNTATSDGALTGLRRRTPTPSPKARSRACLRCPCPSPPIRHPPAPRRLSGCRGEASAAAAADHPSPQLVCLRAALALPGQPPVGTGGTDPRRAAEPPGQAHRSAGALERPHRRHFPGWHRDGRHTDPRPGTPSQRQPLVIDEAAVGHLASRPSWNCFACEQPWPCANAKIYLVGEYTGNTTALQVYLAGCFHDALCDLTSHGERVPADLYERFLVWAVSR